MKRIFDLVSSLIAFIIFSPIFLIIAITIKATSKGPIFFKQRRIGRYNEEFNILKFRTMRIDTPNVATHLLENPEQYITSIGKFMRKTSLDELPQLINIIRGEMSVVGPRPALYNQDDLNQMRTKKCIHKLMPGLTGWAQINGRDEIPLKDKVALDKYYLDNRSFMLDIKIIFKTIFSVLKSDGVKEGQNGNDLNSKEIENQKEVVK
ncbi:MAG: sugar transferase [Clostridium sp.]